MVCLIKAWLFNMQCYILSIGRWFLYSPIDLDIEVKKLPFFKTFVQFQFYHPCFLFDDILISCSIKFMFALLYMFQIYYDYLQKPWNLSWCDKSWFSSFSLTSFPITPHLSIFLFHHTLLELYPHAVSFTQLHHNFSFTPAQQTIIIPILKFNKFIHHQSKLKKVN